MIKKTTKEQSAFREPSDSKKVHSYVTKEHEAPFSLALTEGKNLHDEETCEYDRAYFLLEGAMHIESEGEAIDLIAEESCFIGKGTAYTMSGTFRAVIVNSPAYGSI